MQARGDRQSGRPAPAVDWAQRYRVRPRNINPQTAAITISKIGMPAPIEVNAERTRPSTPAAPDTLPTATSRYARCSRALRGV